MEDWPSPKSHEKEGPLEQLEAVAAEEKLREVPAVPVAGAAAVQESEHAVPPVTVAVIV